MDSNRLKYNFSNRLKLIKEDRLIDQEVVQLLLLLLVNYLLSLDEKLIIATEDTCYVANVGDSRAVISQDGGKNIFSLTRDHKPMDEVENKRIHENGGTVYQ